MDRAGKEIGRGEAVLSVLRVPLTILFLIQGAAGFFPGTLLWGANHLAYAPAIVRLLLPLLGIGLLWIPLPAGGAGLATRLANALLGRARVCYLVLPIVAMVLFWLMRSRLHFLGDGWLLGELVQRRLPFHGFDFLDYHMHARLFGWLGLSEEEQAFRLFALFSVLVGGLYVAAAAWGARRLSLVPAGRLMLFALLVFSAPVQMFMGYVECYALLALLLLVFLTLFILHYRGEVPAAAPAGAFGLALAVHLDALFLAPLLLALVFLPPVGDRASASSEAGTGRRASAPRSASAAPGPSMARRLMHVALPVAGGLILAASLLLAGGYNARWFQLDFLTGRESHPFLVPGQELLDPRHWKDILNLLMLLVPVPLAMIAGLLAGWWRGRAGKPRDGRVVAILLGGCGWLVLLMVVLHQRLGVVRDWDLFAAPAGIFALTAILLWQSRMPGERGSAQPAAAGRAGEGTLVLAAAALLISAPWFWLNAGEVRALARFRDVIEDLPRFPRAYAHEEIGKYFRKAGNLTEACREYEVCVSIHPTNPRFHALLGSMLYNQGDADAALPVFQRVFELDSTYTTGLEMLARIHIERGQHAQALEYARRLAGKRGERAAAAVHHGIAAANLQLYPEAVQAYERALRLEPGNPSHLERLGAILLISGDAARAEQAFRALLSEDPADRTALLGLLTALWLPCELDPSSAMDARGQGRLKEARALVERLASAGESEENLAEWRVKIAAVSDRGGTAAPRP